MSIYIRILLVAIVTIYIVDISGFTDSWRRLLSGWLKVKALRSLPPFDCGKCMTWWVCLVYGAVKGDLSLPVIAFIAGLSLLSVPIGQAMLFIREGTLWIIDKLMPRR